MGAYEFEGSAVTTFYKDSDNDGYSDGTTKVVCSDPPAGYKAASALKALTGDCNDDDGALNSATKWYKDADNDGYSDGTVATQCQQPAGYKLATNLTATSGDCNDGDPTLTLTTDWYKDADNDGYSDGTKKTQCTRPGGYKSASELIATTLDCNDGNPALNPATKWYKDSDGDGYSVGSTVTQCTRPSSDYKLASELKATSVDCSDSNPAVNPGAVEVCGNRIDDNCDGQVDEKGCSICQNARNLSTTNITSTTAQLNWVATANPQQWQVQYKTTSTGSKWVDVLLTGNIRSIAISSLKSKQSYNWHIRAKCNGSWTSYSGAVSFKTTASTKTAGRELILPGGDKTTITDLQVKVMPNPSTNYFTIVLQCNEAKGKTQMLVTDALGRRLETRQSLVSQTLQLGSTYRPGIYFVSFVQGQQSRVLKLVKLSN
jgi:hypothetical protein